jgi:hypothetical protein
MAGTLGGGAVQKARLGMLDWLGLMVGEFTPKSRVPGATEMVPPATRVTAPSEPADPPVSPPFPPTAVTLALLVMVCLALMVTVPAFPPAPPAPLV